MSMSVVFLRAVVSAAEQLHIPEARILREAGLSEDTLCDVSMLVNQRDASALIDAVLRLGQDPALGLAVGALCNETSLHLLGHLLLASPTLRDACAALSEYGPVVLGEPHLRLQEGAFGTRLTVQWMDKSDAARFVAEVYLSLAFKLVQRYAGPAAAAAVHGVHVGHARPRHAARYAQAFPVPVTFDQQQHAVLFASELLDRKSSARDPQLVHALVTLIQETFVAPRSERSWSDRIRRALKQETDLAHVDFDQLAFRWGVTHRTLRRRVQNEGQSLSDLLDRARFERATAQLERPEESIKEVAERLGYAETSSFHRAFKRWSGLTPSAYRKRAQGEHALV